MLDEDHGPRAARIVNAHAVVEKEFASLQFPIPKQQAIARVGDAPLGEDLCLADILRGLPEKAFHDPFKAARAADQRLDAILRAVEAVERAERQGR